MAALSKYPLAYPQMNIVTDIVSELSTTQLSDLVRFLSARPQAFQESVKKYSHKAKRVPRNLLQTIFNTDASMSEILHRQYTDTMKFIESRPQSILKTLNKNKHVKKATHLLEHGQEIVNGSFDISEKGIELMNETDDILVDLGLPKIFQGLNFTPGPQMFEGLKESFTEKLSATSAYISQVIAEGVHNGATHAANIVKDALERTTFVIKSIADPALSIGERVTALITIVVCMLLVFITFMNFKQNPLGTAIGSILGVGIYVSFDKIIDWATTDVQSYGETHLDDTVKLNLIQSLFTAVTTISSASSKKEWDVNKWNIERFSKSIQVARNLKSVYDFFAKIGEYLISKLYEHFTGMPFLNTVQKTIRYHQKDQVVRAAAIEQQIYDREGQSLDDQTILQIAQLYEEMMNTWTQAEVNDMPPASQTIWKSAYAIIKREALKLKYSSSNREDKPEPINIMFIGDPGAGKTTASRLFQQYIAEAVFPGSKIQDISYAYPADKFWDGYTYKHYILTIDDMFQNPSTVESQLLMEKFIKFDSVLNVPLMMSTTEEKGSVYFESKYIVMTSNMTDYSTANLGKLTRDPAAFLRRLDFLVVMNKQDNTYEIGDVVRNPKFTIYQDIKPASREDEVNCCGAHAETIMQNQHLSDLICLSMKKLANKRLHIKRLQDEKSLPIPLTDDMRKVIAEATGRSEFDKDAKPYSLQMMTPDDSDDDAEEIPQLHKTTAQQRKENFDEAMKQYFPDPEIDSSDPNDYSYKIENTQPPPPDLPEDELRLYLSEEYPYMTPEQEAEYRKLHALRPNVSSKPKDYAQTKSNIAFDYADIPDEIKPFDIPYHRPKEQVYGHWAEEVCRYVKTFPQLVWLDKFVNIICHELAKVTSTINLATISHAISLFVNKQNLTPCCLRHSRHHYLYYIFINLRKTKSSYSRQKQFIRETYFSFCDLWFHYYDNDEQRFIDVWTPVQSIEEHNKLMHQCGLATEYPLLMAELCLDLESAANKLVWYFNGACIALTAALTSYVYYKYKEHKKKRLLKMQAYSQVGYAGPRNVAQKAPVHNFNRVSQLTTPHPQSQIETQGLNFDRIAKIKNNIRTFTNPLGQRTESFFLTNRIVLLPKHIVYGHNDRQVRFSKKDGSQTDVFTLGKDVQVYGFDDYDLAFAFFDKPVSGIKTIPPTYFASKKHFNSIISNDMHARVHQDNIEYFTKANYITNKALNWSEHIKNTTYVKCAIPGAKGYCLTVYLASVGKYGDCIWGAHHSGDDFSVSFAAPLTKTFVEGVIRFFEETTFENVEPQGTICDRFMDEMPREFVRVDDKMYHNPRTAYVATVFQHEAVKEGKPILYSPALLDDTPTQKVFENSLKKKINFPAFPESQPIPQSMYIAADYIKHKLSVFKDSQPTTLYEALNGNQYVPAITVSTGSGYGFKRKSYYLIRNEEGDLELTPEAFREFNEVMYYASMNQPHPNYEPVIQDCLKDETLPNKKITEGRSRIMGPMGFYYMLLERMTFMPLMTAILKHRIAGGPIDIGIDYATDWNRMIKMKLKGLDPSTVAHAGDFASMDAHFIKQVFDIISDLAIEMNPSPFKETATIIRWINDTFGSYSKHRILDVEYQTSCNASGRSMTTYNNSLLVWLIILATTIEKVPQAPGSMNYDVLDEISGSTCIFGDDHVIAVPREGMPFTMFDLADMSARVGQEYTSIYKDRPLVPFFEWDEVVYLQRHLVNNPNEFAAAPLRQEIIEQMMYWAKETLPAPLREVELYTSNLYECVQHGEDYFNARKKYLRGILLNQYPGLELPFLDYHVIRAHMYGYSLAPYNQQPPNNTPLPTRYDHCGPQGTDPLPLNMDNIREEPNEVEEHSEMNVMQDTTAASANPTPVEVDVYHGLAVYEDPQLSKTLSRFVECGHQDWLTNTPVGTNFWSSTSFLGDILDDPYINRKIKNYRYFRCGIEVEFRVNSSPIAAGLAVCAWNYGAVTAGDFNELTNYPHSVLDLSKQNVLRMVIPYRHNRDWYRQNAGGTFFAQAPRMTLQSVTSYIPGNSTVGISSVCITAYARLIDIELAGPIQMQSSSMTTQPQNNAMYDNEDVFKRFTISDGSSDLPVQQLTVKDSPTVLQVVPHIRNRPISSLNQVDAINTSEKLAFTKDAYVYCDHDMLGDPVDYDDWTNYARIPAIVDSFSFNSSSGQNSRVWFDTVGEPVPNQPFTHAQLLRSTHSYWRGSVKWHIKFVCSRFTTARVVLVYHPDVVPLTMDGAFSSLVTRVIDIQGTTEISIKVPYLGEYLWSLAEVGQIGIYVVNPPTNPSGEIADTAVQTVVWRSYDSDLQMTRALRPPPGVKPAQQEIDDFEHVEMQMTDTCDMRELFRTEFETIAPTQGVTLRYNLPGVDQVRCWSDFVRRYQEVAWSTGPLSLILPFTPTNQQESWITVLKKSFRRFSGSVRIKVKAAKVTQAWTDAVSEDWGGEIISTPDSNAEWIEIEVPMNYRKLFAINDEPAADFPRLSVSPIPSTFYFAAGEDFIVGFPYFVPQY